MEEDANIAKVRRNVFKLVKVDGEANDTNRIAVIYSAKVGRDRTETNDRNDPKSRLASPDHTADSEGLGCIEDDFCNYSE